MALERAAKGADTAKFAELMNEVVSGEGPQASVATFVGDSLHGNFPVEFLKFVGTLPRVKLVDAAPFFEKNMSVKGAGEQVRYQNSDWSHRSLCRTS